MRRSSREVPKVLKVTKMKKLLPLVLLLIINVNSLPGQSDSVRLKQLASGVYNDLVGNILPFWSVKMVDRQNGGLYGRMDGNNKLYPEAEKGGILNARILWTFSSAYRVLKDSTYLETATYSFNYIFDKFIDRENGGTFRSVNAKGLPSDTGSKPIPRLFSFMPLPSITSHPVTRKPSKRLKRYFIVWKDSASMQKITVISRFTAATGKSSTTFSSGKKASLTRKR